RRQGRFYWAAARATDLAASIAAKAPPPNPCTAAPPGRWASALQQLLPGLHFLLRGTTQQLQRLAQAEARQVWSQVRHGIQYRDGAGLAGDGHEQQWHQVPQLQLQPFGHLLDGGGNTVLVPLAQALEVPQQQLQRLTDFVLGGLLVRELRGIHLQLASHEEARQRHQVAEGFHPALHQRHDGPQIIAVDRPLLYRLDEILLRQITDPLPIQPRQLLDIEDRPAEGYSLDIEVLHHFIQGEFLAFVRHRPAHAAQVVQQRLGQVAHPLVEDDAGGVLALGQLALVRVAQQRHVAQLRHVPAKVLIQQDVLGC